LMQNQKWESDVEEAASIDVGSMTRTIEHARSETQAFLGSSNNYVAALIGALAGGIVSLTVSQLPALLAFLASIHVLLE